MRYIIIILILLSSCRTTKTKTHEIEKFKSEVILKVDSLSIKIREFRELKTSFIDSTKTDFQIDFDKHQVGEIELQTPQGIYTAKKQGNGKVTISGTSKITKEKSTKKDALYIQNEKTTKQKDKRQSENESTYIHKEKSLSPWWFWVALIGIVIIFYYLRKIIWI